jgi:hypothetical protein
LRINFAENDKTGVNMTEEMVRASKDITYVKENKREDNKFTDYLKNLTDEQKLLVFHTMRGINLKDNLSFKNLLMNQSEDFLKVFLELQREFINKYSPKQNTTINKIV